MFELPGIERLLKLTVSPTHFWLRKEKFAMGGGSTQIFWEMVFKHPLTSVTVRVTLNEPGTVY
jgi:hypothetical protein